MTVPEFLVEVRKLVLQFSLGELPGFRHIQQETQGRGEGLSIDPVTQYYLLHRAYFGSTGAGGGLHPLRQRLWKIGNGTQAALEHHRTGRPNQARTTATEEKEEAEEAGDKQRQ